MMPATAAPAPNVTKSIGKAQQIHVLVLAKRLTQPNPTPMRALSNVWSANEESSIAVRVSRVDLIIKSVIPVVTTESRTNVRFGSLAACQHHIRRTAGFERLPAVQIVENGGI